MRPFDRPPTAWRDDERAGFPVVEAMLVAVLVFGSILFVGLSRRPTVDISEGADDLAVLASDTMRVLEEAQIDGNDVDGWFTPVISGDLTTANEVHAYIQDLLGEDVFYLLRLNNGYGTLPLLPPATGLDAQPVAARSAQMALVPSTWAKGSSEAAATCPLLNPGCVDDIPYAIVAPGDAYTVPAGCVASGIRGPNNSNLGPAMGTVLSWWDRWDDTPGEVPSSAPFGFWLFQGTGCTAAHAIHVLPGDLAYHPPQSIELVVWHAA